MPALPVQRQPQSLMAIDMNSSHDLAYMASGSRTSSAEERERLSRMRVKSHHRLRSSQQILVDFRDQAKTRQEGQDDADDADEIEDEEDDEPFEDDVFSSPPQSFPSTPLRKEDTARRSKRFSLPAVAVHATSVTARMAEGVGNMLPQSTTDEQIGESTIGGITASPSRTRRFSLVLAGRNSHYVGKNGNEDGDLGKGVAAVKLAELLKKSKVAST